MPENGPDGPEDTPDRDPKRPDPNNPFAGTPLEALFGQFSAGGGVPDLGALMGQMQQMFTQQHDGPIDRQTAVDVARRTSAAAGPDPSPTSQQQGSVDDAVRLAETWLDRATTIPVGATSSTAWSRADWIEQTAPTWHTLVEPVAEHVVGAMGDAMPAELKAMAGPLIGMLTQAGGALFGQQLGQALGALSGEVATSTDIGLPLGPDRVAAVLPGGVAAFGEGLEVARTDVMLYLVLRECAHHRLFQHAAWLRPALLSAIEEYGRGARIDLSAIEGKLTGFDPSRPDEIAEAMQNGLFEPEPTPEQRQALERLELLLALVEGWVDEVVAQATEGTMPAAGALAEAMRRRRATGGPAERTFASLVGLELRPRRLRDAANLWAAVRDRQDAEARDRLWSHPDLLPTAGDLDDPLGFADQTPDDVDEAIGRLLDDTGE